MPSLIFDFADIRSRMLGDDKPAPKAIQEPAPFQPPPCHTHPVFYVTIDPAYRGADQTVVLPWLPLKPKST